jgi:hypothetical protein
MDNPYTLASDNIGHTYTGKWQHWAHIHWQVATLGTQDEEDKQNTTQKKMNNTEPIKN